MTNKYGFMTDVHCPKILDKTGKVQAGRFFLQTIIYALLVLLLALPVHAEQQCVDNVNLNGKIASIFKGAGATYCSCSIKTNGNCYWGTRKKSFTVKFYPNFTYPRADDEDSKKGLDTNNYYEGGAYWTQRTNIIKKMDGTIVRKTPAVSMYCAAGSQAETQHSFLQFHATSGNTGENYSHGEMKGILKSAFAGFVQAGICKPDIIDRYGSVPAAKPAPQAVTAEEEVPEDTCYNRKKDPNEEGVDCGGPCDPCKEKIFLDKTDFVGNFNGTDRIVITGRVIKVLHPYKENLNKGLPGVNVTIGGWGRAGKLIKKRSATTNGDGRFRFEVVLPEYRYRDKLKGKKVGINVSTQYLNRHVYINQTQSAPRIINLKKLSAKPLGADSWGSFSFDVIDQENAVEKIVFYAPSGMLRWANNKRHVGTLQEGSGKNMAPVKLTGLYPGGQVNFSWKSPPVGLQFDASFLQRQKEAFFGSDSVTVGSLKMGNDELLNYAKGQVDDAADNLRLAVAKYNQKMLKSGVFKTAEGFRPTSNGIFISNENLNKLKSVKDSNALGHFDRFMNGYKTITGFKDNMKTIADHAKVVVQEAETGSEGMVNGMLIGIEGIGIIEGGFQALLGKDFMTGPGGKTLTQFKKFTYGAVIKGLKGTLNYAADTFKEGRAKERIRQLPLVVQAFDRAGNASEEELILVDVLYYSSSQEGK